MSQQIGVPSTAQAVAERLLAGGRPCIRPHGVLADPAVFAGWVLAEVRRLTGRAVTMVACPGGVYEFALTGGHG